MNQLSHSEVWRGTYKEYMQYKITRWQYDSLLLNHPNCWNYYIFLHERYTYDFDRIWLPAKVVRTLPESYGFISYPYEQCDLLDAAWHGGITYYDKHGEIKGHRCVEIGCDYQHLRDNGILYTLEEIQHDCLKSCEILFTRFIYGSQQACA